MDNASATSLVRFINEHSTRFSAWTLDFAERTWVILRDARAVRTAPCEEPILDVPDYIERLSRRTPQNFELRTLLEVWLGSGALTDETPGQRQPVLSGVAASPTPNSRF